MAPGEALHFLNSVNLKLECYELLLVFFLKVEIRGHFSLGCH